MHKMLTHMEHELLIKACAHIIFFFCETPQHRAPTTLTTRERALGLQGPLSILHSARFSRAFYITYANEDMVRNVNVKRFLATIIVLLVAAVMANQVSTVKAATTLNFTLYGSYTSGWGFTATTITSPGPTITVEQGDTVNLTLISKDGYTHAFFVSYTNASLPGTGDPLSPDIGSNAVNFQFVATNTVGTYKYHCLYHPDPMWGYFKVVLTGTIPEFQPLIMLSLLIGGTAVALVCRRKQQI